MLPSGDSFTLTLPFCRWSPPPSSTPGSPVSPPSLEIYIIDGCFLSSSVTTVKVLSWLILAPSLCPPLWSVSSVVVRAVFLKAEAIPQCLRLPTALGIKSRFLKCPPPQPPLALGLCPSSPEPPCAAPLGPIVSLGRKLWGGPPGSSPEQPSEAALLTQPVPGVVWAGGLRERALIPARACLTFMVSTGLWTFLCVPWLP